MPTCADCAGDFGSIHCGGDCRWTGSVCVAKETQTQAPAPPVTQAPVTQAPTQRAECDTSGEDTIKSGQLRGYTCSQLADYCKYSNIFNMMKEDTIKSGQLRGYTCSQLA